MVSGVVKELKDPHSNGQKDNYVSFYSSHARLDLVHLLLIKLCAL